MNERITSRERGLIKGALRRVFSRSDLRRDVIATSIIKHTDPRRPRVKAWGLCAVCRKHTPKSYLVVDHILPLIPVDQSFEEMSMDTFLDRLWCDPSNLQAICEICHFTKTSQEGKLRREFKKSLKETKHVRNQINKRPSTPNRKRRTTKHSKRTVI